MLRVGKTFFFILLLLTVNTWLSSTAYGEQSAPDAGKPRLVMVKVPHWKVHFFNLPD